MITVYHYLTLSVLLFVIGIYGVLTRRNAIGILMSIELMLNSVNINLVAFSQLGLINQTATFNLSGQVFVLFIIALAATEAAIGFALIFVLVRNFGTLYIDKINLLSG